MRLSSEGPVLFFLSQDPPLGRAQGSVWKNSTLLLEGLSQFCHNLTISSTRGVKDLGSVYRRKVSTEYGLQTVERITLTQSQS